MRFDEIELDAVPLGGTQNLEETVRSETSSAPRLKRSLALLTDLSLFAALALALSPLTTGSARWQSLAALAGFIVIVSYYYFAGSWMLWGRTVGGIIFDVHIVTADGGPVPLREATLRWVGLCLSLLTAGGGFLFAALPSGRSIADRISDTHGVTA